MHAMINNNIIEVYSTKKLKNAFPEMDKFKLKAFEAERRMAKQWMLNLKFDS